MSGKDVMQLGIAARYLAEDGRLYLDDEKKLWFEPSDFRLISRGYDRIWGEERAIIEVPLLQPCPYLRPALCTDYPRCMWGGEPGEVLGEEANDILECLHCQLYGKMMGRL